MPLKKREDISIGWIGTPFTSKYLLDILPALEYINLKYDIKIIGIGFDDSLLHEKKLYKVFHGKKIQVKYLNNLDIGLMPLHKEPFEKGKCGYKLIQYMACKLPTVASPVGANKEIISHGINGFLAKDLKDWKKYLSLLIEDSLLREKMGKEGYKRMKQKYSLQVQAPLLSQI